MAWTDTGRKAAGGASSGTTMQVTLNSTAAGSMIVVGGSAYSTTTAPTTTISDNVNGSYGAAIQERLLGAVDLRSFLFVFPNNAGGNLTITATRTVAGFGWMAAHEFAGGATTSPLSGTPNGLGGTTGTTISSGTTTPADNNCLAIAVSGIVGTGAITENAGAEGYTLSNEYEDLGSPTMAPGSMVFKILSGGSGVAQSHSWSLATTPSGYANVIATFKPSPPASYSQTKFRVYTDTGTGLGEAA